MNQLIEAVKAYFQEKKWYWQQTDDNTLRGSICGDNGRWEWFAHGEREDALLYFYSVCPVTVPKERRAAAAEFLTRANYGMPLGNFEMDYADGEVRCRICLPLEAGQVPSQGRLEDIIHANFRTLDRYLPGLLAVICGKTTPRRAKAPTPEPAVPETACGLGNGGDVAPETRPCRRTRSSITGSDDKLCVREP